MKQIKGKCINTPLCIYKFLQLNENNVKEFIDLIYSETPIPENKYFKQRIFNFYKKYGDVIYCEDADLYYEEEGFNWLEEKDYDCYNFEIGDIAVLNVKGCQPYRVSEEEFKEKYTIIQEDLCKLFE